MANAWILRFFTAAFDWCDFHPRRCGLLDAAFHLSFPVGVLAKMAGRPGRNMMINHIYSSIVINGLFWTGCVGGIAWFVRRMLKRLRRSSY
jgi:hypothetical protein